MSRDTTTLFIFEGETLEGQIFDSLVSHFFPPTPGKIIIKSFFYGEIYQLWEKVNEIKNVFNLDIVDVDIVDVLKAREKERKEKNNKEPDPDIMNLNVKSIDEVYLFFDHDTHSHFKKMTSQKYHETINNMLDTFNDAQGLGKLWISYPMVEALKHCKKNPDTCFFDAHIKISENTNYKKLINDESDYQNIRKFDKSIWYYLSAVNIQRAYCLVNDTQGRISDYNSIKKKWFEESPDIARMIQEKQYIKFIEPKDEVVALSPFPLFLLNRRGKSFFDECCKCEQVIKVCNSLCCQR